MVVLVVAALAGWLPARPSGQIIYDRGATVRQPRAPAWLREKLNMRPMTTPRTPWGEPDFRGSWGTEEVTSDSIERIEDWLDPATPPTETFIVDTVDGKVPYQPWAAAERTKMRMGLSRGWPGEAGPPMHMDPQSYCVTGIPRITWRDPWLVQQSPGYVHVNIGWGHYYRTIPTDGRRIDLDPSVKLWMGLSRGRWDGDSLVVEVSNLNGKVWFDSYANFHSDRATMTERWTQVRTEQPDGTDRVSIDWSVRVDDPSVFTQPWTMNLPLRRKTPEEIWEHACHEGNERLLEGVKTHGFRWFGGIAPPPADATR